MKKYLLQLLLICPFVASAQLTLDKNYNGVIPNLFQVVNIEDDGHLYMTYNNASLNFYTPDHNLKKAIPVSAPSGSTVYSINCASKHFFDNDDDIEVCVTITGQTDEVRIYNDDGSILQTIPGLAAFPKKVNSQWKLVVYNTTSGIDVYSVPGQYLGILPNKGNSSPAEVDAMIFPNPMGTAATVSYTLPAGIHQGVLEVYTMAGSLARSYNVTDQFSNIIIERGTLAPGTYTYQLKASGAVPTTQKFIIQ